MTGHSGLSVGQRIRKYYTENEEKCCGVLGILFDIIE